MVRTTGLSFLDACDDKNYNSCMRRSVHHRGVLQTALRVLKAYTEHRTPQLGDIELLKKHALPSEVDLPIDDLVLLC